MSTKLRFSTPDVQAICRDLRSTIMGQRISNIYDVDDKTYLFKFATPGLSEKPILLVESGIRFHTTKYSRNKNEMPSPFTMKLRKYIRSKRLDCITQLGNDRVVDLKFGSAESTHHIILELYANGNIILTDQNYEILSLLRSHQFEEDIAIRVGEIYPLNFALNNMTTSAIPSAAQDGNDSSDSMNSSLASSSVFNMSATEFIAWAEAKESLKLELYGGGDGGGGSNTNTNTTANLPVIVDDDEVDNTNKKVNKKNNNLKLPTTQKKQQKLTNLKQLLLSKDSGVSNLGGEIIDHCILSANLNPTLKVQELFTAALSKIPSSTGNVNNNITAQQQQHQQLTAIQVNFMNNYDLLLQQLELGRTLIDKLNIPGQCGYILYKPMSANSSNSCVVNTAAVTVPISTADSTTTLSNDTSAIVNKEYLEYVPFFLKQHESKAHLIFSSFDEAVDEYYYKIDDQKLIKKSSAIEENHKKKLEKMKQDQSKMLTSLITQQNNMELNAMVIEYYADEVDKVCLVLNSAIENGMDWDSIEAMVKNEGENGNPIANLIWKLKLERNHVILRLKNVLNNNDDSDDDDDDDDDDRSSESDKDDDGSDNDDEEDNNKKNKHTKKKQSQQASSPQQQYVDVEIDLSLSAYANARNMFSHKKTAHSKELKTIESSHRALDAVEHQIAKSLSKQKVVNSLRAVRKIHWFEKFNWFISSEGYLVLSGRDAQQNEALVKKYMRSEDIYVHANLSGAATCIVRNKTVTGVVSPVAMHEAATVAVCRSVAWSNKAVTSAWWVYASQVSKTAPSGEFLTTGSFMIYGIKNFLPPSTLEMGFAIMFRLEDSCVLRHVAERKDRVKLMDVDELESVCSEAYDRYGIDIDITSHGSHGSNIAGHSNNGDGQGEEGVNGDDGNHEGSSSMTMNVQTKKQLRQQKLLQKQSKPAHKVLTSVAEEAEDDREDGEESNGENDNDGDEDSSDEDDENDDEGSDDSDTDVRGTTSKAAAIGGKQQQQQLKKSDVSTNKKESSETTATGQIKGKDTKPPPAAVTEQQQAKSSKKKVLNKKKSRRYAEQDDEDKLLALQSLGHIVQGQLTVNEKETQLAEEKKKKQVIQKQSRVGINSAVKKSWSDMLQILPPAVQNKIHELTTTEVIFPADTNDDENITKATTIDNISKNNNSKNRSKATTKSTTTANNTTANASNSSTYTVLKENELDIYEINCLLAFSTDTCMLEILELFRQGVIEKKGKVGNKSGFLAGIMKRYQKDQKEKEKEVQKEVVESSSSSSNSSGISREVVTDDSTNKTTAESESPENEKDDEGDDGAKEVAGPEHETEVEEGEEEVEEEDINNIVDDLDKLTGCPLPNDILLYALPVCGPFHTLQRFKYRVKLTPGTGKKGKICKQALEIFLQQSHVNNSNSSTGITNLSTLSLMNNANTADSNSVLNSSSVTSTTTSNNTSSSTQQMENMLLKGLTDTEMVAIMMSDTKISTPGLQTLKNKSKKAQRGAKKSNKYVNNSY